MGMIPLITSLRTYQSCSSSVSSISGEQGCSACSALSSASYTDVDETRKWVLAWAKQVANSDDGHDSEVQLCATFRLVKKGRKLTRKARAAVRRRNASCKSRGGEAGPDTTLNSLNVNTSKVLQGTAGNGPVDHRCERAGCSCADSQMTSGLHTWWDGVPS